MPSSTARLTGVRSRPLGYRRRREPLWSSRELFYADAALFLFGAAGAYSANIIGALPGCEILLIPMLPIMLLAQGKRAFDRQYVWFYIMTGAWLLGTLMADAYNDIGAFNRIKGIARVVFFALDFMALAIMINNKTRRMVVFALSIAAMMFLGSLQFSGDFLLQFKFGLSQTLAMLSLLISAYYYKRRRYRICLLIVLVLAGIDFRYGFRSQLVILLVSAALVLPLFESAPARSKIPHGNQNTVRVLVLLALAGGAAYAANAAIKYAAHKGLFDEGTNEKFETQSGGDYGVLVGGRPETLVAIQAIRDSPIFGHGSFPYGLKYLQLQQDIQYEHGYSDSDDPKDVAYPVIPTHSHLTLAWVEGGILGGICWIYILFLTIRALMRLSSLRPDLAPLYSYLLVNFLWDILYSPFGSVNRIRAAFHILLCFLILRNSAKTTTLGRYIEKKIYRGPKTLPLAPVGASSRTSGRSAGGLGQPRQV